MDTALLRKPYTVASTALVPGQRVPHGRGVLISCTASGMQALTLQKGTTILVAVTAGTTLLLDDFGVVAAPGPEGGTTAVALVYVLD